MTWDEDLPDNATKIRVYPQVLTDNWKAVQAGDISLQYRATNFIDRSTASEAPATTPTRNDDTMIMYSKNDGTNTELFVLNDQNPAADLQLTQVDRLGSDSTNFAMNNIKFDTTSYEFDQRNFIVAHGSFDSSGTAIGTSYNMTGSQTSTGKYTVSVNSDVLLNDNYRAILTSFRSGGGNQRNFLVTDKASVAGATPTLVTIESRNTSNDLTNSSFEVIIVGGR